MRFDVFHKFLEGEFSVQLHQLTKPFEVQIKKNAVSNFSPSAQIVLAPVGTRAGRPSVDGPAVEGVVVTRLGHVNGEGDGEVHGFLHHSRCH